MHNLEKWLNVILVEDRNGSIAIMAAKRSAGIAPEANLRNPLRVGDEARKQGNLPWLRNPEQMSPEVQNRDISSPTKGLMSSKSIPLANEVWGKVMFCYTCLFVKGRGSAYEGVSTSKGRWSASKGGGWVVCLQWSASKGVCIQGGLLPGGGGLHPGEGFCIQGKGSASRGRGSASRGVCNRGGSITRTGGLKVCIQGKGVCIQGEGVCIQREGACIQGEGICIQGGLPPGGWVSTSGVLGKSPPEPQKRVVCILL